MKTRTRTGKGRIESEIDGDALDEDLEEDAGTEEKQARSHRRRGCGRTGAVRVAVVGRRTRVRGQWKRRKKEVADEENDMTDEPIRRRRQQLQLRLWLQLQL